MSAEKSFPLASALFLESKKMVVRVMIVTGRHAQEEGARQSEVLQTSHFIATSRLQVGICITLDYPDVM